MERYGLRGVVKDWFYSYLSERKQYTVMNNVISDFQTISTGVPQGSVPGPTLFLLYINDIRNLVNDSNKKLMLSAYDSNAFIIHKNMTELKQLAEEPIYKLCNWFCANRLTLILDKSNFSIFTHLGTKLVMNLIP